MHIDESYRWIGGFCIEVSPVPNGVIIFGASGDLAARKLIPSLYSLYTRKLFHEKSFVVGCARTPMTDDAFRAKMEKSLRERFKNIDETKLGIFLKKLYYQAVQYDDIQSYRNLDAKLKSVALEDQLSPGLIFYLSTPASVYVPVVNLLGETGLVKENHDGIPWRNVVLEKPFGRDLESAKKLDRELREVLHERQIYRIDHYLGKETVQNILMLRFANRIFDPVWNNNYIDNVQITVGESLGIEHRAGYYEQAGLLRDMFQNHMLQLMSLVAMEAPPSFDPHCLRDEKEKLLRSVRHFPLKDINKYIVRGQYTPGNIDGQSVCGYREEENVPADSQIETFVAAKLFIDNWRWQGVPFYLRSGKRMPRKLSQIVITFKRVPHSIFGPIRSEDLAPNVLVLNVQPEEGLALTIQAKQPGPKLCMGSLTMDFKYSSIFDGDGAPEAYERLLLDCMLGDQTLFIRSDCIELSWELLTPVLNAWQDKRTDAGDLLYYPAGSWGPEAAEKLLRADGFKWFAN